MKSSGKKKRRRCKRDRLSDLPDAILGHVLSFLPAKEASRATVLSRRWRHAFADVVHTISFGTPASCSDNSSGSYRDCWTLQREHFHHVTAALLARRLCGGGGGEEARLRCLRVSLHGCRSGAPGCISWDSSVVDQWLSYALAHGVQELYLQTRTLLHDTICPLCCGPDSDTDSEEEDDMTCSLCFGPDISDTDNDTGSEEEDVEYPTTNSYGGYVVPATLFSCATLRSLHLVACSLPPSLASTVHLPSLETLALSKISNSVSSSASASARRMQLLISGCPRLADLTLEACQQIKDITVDNRLRSFALRCCHSVRRVTIDLSETRVFEYLGVAPDASCFALVGGGSDPPTGIASSPSAKISVCCGTPSGKVNFERLRRLLLMFVNARHLHLGWPDVAKNSPSDRANFFTLFPRFDNLTRLELRSRCRHPGAVDAVAGILRQTPNLTALSLKFGNRSIAIDAYNPRFAVDVSGVPVAPCLRERVREMSVEMYEGSDMQRMLLKALLRGALVLESVRVVFSSGRYSLGELTNEIKSWAANPATKMTLGTL